MFQRALEVELIDGSVEARTITGGVPQGSVINPTFSNVFYDDRLKFYVPPSPMIS